MKKTTVLILMLFSLAFTFSCHGMIGKVKTSLVTVKISGRTAMLDITPATFAEKARRFLARAFSLPVANAAIPSSVQDLRITVSAADMTTITATVNVAGLADADFTVEVPNGTQRHFMVEGLSSASIAQYKGEAYSDLIGDPVLLTINMAAINVADTTAPVFAGLALVTGATPTSLGLSWAAATDNVTSAANMVYYIYKSAAAGGEDFSAPNFSSPPGATSFIVPGLAQGVPFFFVVRARDEAGNIDNNTIEKSATLPDTVPPAFAGLVSVTVLSSTSLQLSWDLATDNTTAQAGIVYLIYQATSPSGEIYSTPTYTTTAGTTSFTVTGLTPGTTYYFVARAQDEAGNIDSNTIERASTTPDTIPPAFAGLASATTFTATSIQLSWSAATDNVTPQANIVYLVYVAPTSGAENYSSPKFTTTPGATNYTVTGLKQGIPYYFVVQSQDGAGNIDSNTIEKTVTLADTIPPAFAGLNLVSNITLTSMQLSWLPATDNVTPQAKIVYLIYQATSPGGEVYTAPTYSTIPGATNYTVTGLTTAGTTYYFVVRAQDEAGNINSNTSESLPSAYPSKFVNASTGNDSTGDGTQAAPYATITKALTVSAGNEAIKAAAGTYGANETFPLQLKQGTYLFCQGTNHSTVIDGSSSTVAIYGNTGATIDGCKVFPGSDATAIDDQTTPITINNVVIDAISVDYIAWEAVILSADSTVSNSTFVETYSTFITVNSGKPVIKNNTLTGTANSADGILVNAGGNPTIKSNTITRTLNSGGSAISLSSGATATIDSNTISWGLSSGSAGIKISDGSSVITKNTITGNTAGIDTSGGTPTISTNTIGNNTTGINISGGSPAISGNTIGHNSKGIYVTGGLPSLTDNSIYCSTYDDLTSILSVTLLVSNNSWDHYPPTTGINTGGPCSGYPDICQSGGGGTIDPGTSSPAVLSGCTP